MTRALTLLAVGAAVLFVAYWVLIFVTQRALAFPGAPTAGAPPRPADAEVVWLDSPAGRTEAWFLPPLAEHAGPAPLLLFAHGNAELIDHGATAFTTPRQWGAAVLLVEYPGYGRSGGSPSRVAIQHVLEAAHDWALSQPSVDSARIVLWGRSLGGAAVGDLSETRPGAALILQSTFTSAASIAAAMLVPPLLVRDRFDNLSAVRRYRGPILVLHGEHDTVVPTKHGRRLAEAAGVALHLMPCGHNDCEEPWPVIRGFLEEHQLMPGGARQDTTPVD